MSDETTVTVDGEDVRITSPGKIMFPGRGWTKFDVVDHFLVCVDGALTGVFGRPTMLKRWPRGVGEKPFYQKRAPQSAVERIRVKYPSGRSAAWLVPRTPADVIWMAQLNCLDLNPWTSRADHLEQPDELRIDLDPTPEATFADVRRVTLVVGDVLAEHDLVGWPKTSGASGMHVYVRIQPRWSFTEVRRAALAVGRAVEDEVPHLATTAWWKDERHGVFVDYNQNTRDHTIASAYSVRPTGFVSAPLTWAEVTDAEPADFPMVGFAARYRRCGDVMGGIDDAVGRIDSLLELADRQEAAGSADDRPR